VVYGLMIPRECKLLQMREVLAEEHGLPLECQKVVKLSRRQVREGALLREKALGKALGKGLWEPDCAPRTDKSLPPVKAWG
jgi:hypothetical protein